MRRIEGGTLRTMGSMLAVGLAVGAGVVGAVTAQTKGFPETATEAEELYEGDVETWLDGPVEYLVLKEEREIWNDLETNDQRQAFIEWFWARRNDDPRGDENEFKKEFYERVAYSNRRFNGFPRGWKSDRGRVWCTIGRPDSISRRSWSQVVGRGSGPDFEVWTYYTNTRNLGFRARYGEYPVFFIETRPGRAEIWDYRWGAGAYPTGLRRAFEYTNENRIVDPVTEFEIEASEGEFVREVTESPLAIEVDLDSWGPVGNGGMIALPARIRLADLLFSSSDEGFSAELVMEVGLLPESGEPLGGRKEWTVRLSGDELATYGSGSMTVALALQAEPGRYTAELAVQEPLAAATGHWRGEVEVTESGDAANVVAGALPVTLGEDLNAGVGIVHPRGDAFGAGDSLVVAGWMRRKVERQDLGITLVAGDERHELPIDSFRWVAGSAQAVVETRLPGALEGGEVTIVLAVGGEPVGETTIFVES